jgi:hypothetical protein
MQRHMFSIIVSCFCVASCGGVTTTGDSESTNPLGSAEFWVKSSVPAADGTNSPWFTVDAEFLRPGAISCASSTSGAATINPCLSPPPSVRGSDVTSAGEVTVVTPKVTEAIEPESDGDYATGTFNNAPWIMAGESITIRWAHFPGTTTDAGGTFVAKSPPYVTLSTGSPFADPTNTIDRSADVALSWTTDDVPASGDQLGVYFDSGSTQVGVNFDVSAGTGIVPAAVLQTLAAGAGSFDIHSKRSTGETLTAPDGSTWSFSFNIDAFARTRYGVASGKVTFR